MKIFVVEESDYGGVSIEGIFDTKDKAEKFLADFGNGRSDWDIEEYTLNPLEPYW